MRLSRSAIIGSGADAAGLPLNAPPPDRLPPSVLLAKVLPGTRPVPARMPTGVVSWAPASVLAGGGSPSLGALRNGLSETAPSGCPTGPLLATMKPPLAPTVSPSCC
jgi:hypothetical protein